MYIYIYIYEEYRVSINKTKIQKLNTNKITKQNKKKNGVLLRVLLFGHQLLYQCCLFFESCFKC